MCYKFIMRKFLVGLLLNIFVFMQSNIVLAETIQLQDFEKPTVKYNPQIKKDVKNLVIDNEKVLNDIIELQRLKDVEDLEYLWKQTVENSHLVQFALKKLSIPEDQRRLHSSIMAKTISSVVSGAAFLPMLMGQNTLIQSASFSAGRIATGLLNKAETPQEQIMTDTELIELASMVEKLQNDLLNAYYNYKSSLVQLKNVRSRIILANKNLHDAQRTNNKMETMISSNLYDNLLIEEMQVKRKIWCHQLQIQRLAGVDAVKNLNLYQYALNTELINNEVKIK